MSWVLRERVRTIFHPILRRINTGANFVAGRNVPLSATRIYQMSFFTGFGVSALIYVALNILFPVPGCSVKRKFWETDLSNYQHGEGSIEDGVEDDGILSVSSTGKDSRTAVVVQQA